MAAGGGLAIRGFEKGLAEGVGDQQRPKYSENCHPELCSPTHKVGIGKRVHGRDFLSPTPSVRQPPFPKGPKIENIQSRLKFSISLENFDPDLQNSPQKIGVWWAARLQCSISLENFKILKNFNRVHAKGVVLCERACFCLLSAFYNTTPL